MPQMAPLSWILLFMYFSIMFLMTVPLNYFLSPSQITMTHSSMTKINSFKWKW